MPLGLLKTQSAGLVQGGGGSSSVKTRRNSAKTGSIAGRAASLEASMQRRAASQPLQSSLEEQASVEDLFHPFMRENKELPDYAQQYLALLSDSSLTPQKHLVRMLAKGAADISKAAHAMQDPMDAVTDALADHGSRFILSSMDKVEWRIGGLTSPSPSGTYNCDWMACPGEGAGEEGHGEPGPSAEASAEAEAAEGRSSNASQGWRRLRMAVKGAGVFRAAQRHAKDDTCMPEQSASSVNPVHSKALSIMLSVIMSGATSGVSHAMIPAAPTVDLAASAPPSHAIEITHIRSAEASPEVKAVRSAAAASYAHSAPSLRGSFRAPDCADSVVSVSGMAASTAMKLLRSDSKSGVGNVNFNQVFGTILETVNEATEHQRKSGSTSRC